MGVCARVTTIAGLAQTPDNRKFLDERYFVTAQDTSTSDNKSPRFPRLSCFRQWISDRGAHDSVMFVLLIAGLLIRVSTDWLHLDIVVLPLFWGFAIAWGLWLIGLICIAIWRRRISEKLTNRFLNNIDLFLMSGILILAYLVSG